VSSRCAIAPGAIATFLTLAAPAAAAFVGDPAIPPAIAILEAPPACCFGSWVGRLAGAARNIDTDSVAVAVYAKTDLYYVQPYVGSRLDLDAAGGFATDVRGGSRYVALLVRRSFEPAAMCTALPPVGGDVLAVASAPEGERSIDFAGRRWIVKQTGELPHGPGPNLWSDGPESVWVDGGGRLHLRIVQRDGAWFAAEVLSEELVDYGRYRFEVRSAVDRLDPNVVFAGFVYAETGAEIDVEWSRWGDAGNPYAGQFVVQPAQVVPIGASLPEGATTQGFTWGEERVEFELRAGELGGPPGAPLAAAVVEEGVPAPGGTRLRFNLWLVGGAPPSDGQEVEVVVSDLQVDAPTSVHAALPDLVGLHVASPARKGGVPIRFELASPTRVTLRLFDPRGRQVAEVLHGFERAGRHEIEWDSSVLAAGVYFLRLATPSGVANRTVVVAR
jgi:hypothetical protein